MKNHRTVLFVLVLLALLPLAVAGCRSRTDRSEGTVLLSITGLTAPTSVSLGAQTPPITTTITVANVTKDPANGGANLESIELRSYEVRYRRRDTGTRVPPPTVQGFVGLISPNSTISLPVGLLFSDQVLNPPLKDLIDFNRDTETGTAVIVLDATYRVFGRTLSGDEIVSDPATVTLEVRP